MIVIDYLQLMTMGKQNRESRTQEVSDLTRTLKIAAKELNVPVLVLSQLSRAVEMRDDHRPVLSDLRESGSIEQDAGTVYLLISKHRSGSTGEVKLKWVGEYTTFLNYGDKVKYEEQSQS